MTTQEMAILDALNIASTIHRTPARGYGATPAQIAEVLNEDERLRGEYAPDLLMLDGRQLGQHLAGLAGTKESFPNYNRKLGPLVEKFDSRHYRLTDWGCKVLSL